jgi:hypothetical protein
VSTFANKIIGANASNKLHSILTTRCWTPLNLAVVFHIGSQEIT